MGMVSCRFDQTLSLNNKYIKILKYFRENHYQPNILVENANKIKGVIDQFPNEQIKTFLETIEKAIEDKDEEEPFPEMPTNFEEVSLLYFGYKPFSFVLEEFVNSEQK
ncbi:unnamed protein product [Meloidogyne enterolobii]|uniref:Uncharacterized protein n=1 Tax=Meloidogyne enterolobii TaxID=390850 RepID=A0ACB0Z4J6_MELEN